MPDLVARLSLFSDPVHGFPGLPPRRSATTVKRMSENDNGRAHLWRERAHELRSVARGFADPRARDELFLVAEQWDVMARRLECRTPLNLSRTVGTEAA